MKYLTVEPLIVKTVFFLLYQIREWDRLHRDAICDIDTGKKSKDLFVTASQDGFVSLWDVREEDKSACKAKCKQDYQIDLFPSVSEQQTVVVFGFR